jgi:hypothetical protein
VSEFDLTPEASTQDPRVDFVNVSGDVIQRFGSAPLGVWTVPLGVAVFSAAFRGASDPVDPVPPTGAVIYNVPCVPGEHWLLEGGDGPFFSVVAGAETGEACLRNTFHGGDALAAPHAGSGASVLWHRGGIDDVFAVMGGRAGVGGSTSYTEPPDGPVSYGGLVSPAGGSSGADQSTYLDGGAGGGGWPGGAAGAVAGAPGVSGGNYLPAPSGSEITTVPIPSPRLDQLFPTSAVPASPGVGQVWVWYYRQLPITEVGWAIGHIWF